MPFDTISQLEKDPDFAALTPLDKRRAVEVWFHSRPETQDLTPEEQQKGVNFFQQRYPDQIARQPRTGMGDVQVLSGMNPGFHDKLTKLINASGGRLRITDGFRTRAQQEDRYKRKPTLAAYPGHSMHEYGLAADLEGDLEWAHKMAPSFGLSFPMLDPKGRKVEPWHIQDSDAKQLRAQLQRRIAQRSVPSDNIGSLDALMLRNAPKGAAQQVFTSQGLKTAKQPLAPLRNAPGQYADTSGMAAPQRQIIPPRQKETPVQRARRLQQALEEGGAKAHTVEEFMTTPFGMGQAAAEAMTPTGNDPLSAVGRSIMGFGTPTSIALLGAAGGIGAFGPIAARLVRLGFTADMAHSAIQQFREGKPWDAVVSGLLAGLGGWEEYHQARTALANYGDKLKLAAENARLQERAVAQAGGESAFPYGRSVSDATQARQEQEGRVGEHPGVPQGTNLPEDQGQVRQEESGQAGGGRGVVGAAAVGTQEAKPEVKPAGRRRDARGHFTIKVPDQPETPAQATPEPVTTERPKPDGSTYTEHTMPSPLVAAAYRDPAGQVHTGANHPAILTGIHGKVPDQFQTAESRNTPDFGFVDKAGNFLDRKEAAVRAKQTGQDLKAFELGEPAHSDEVAAKSGGIVPISESGIPVTTASAPDTFTRMSEVGNLPPSSNAAHIMDFILKSPIPDVVRAFAEGRIKRISQVFDGTDYSSRDVDASLREAFNKLSEPQKSVLLKIALKNFDESTKDFKTEFDLTDTETKTLDSVDPKAFYFAMEAVRMAKNPTESLQSVTGVEFSPNVRAAKPGGTTPISETKAPVEHPSDRLPFVVESQADTPLGTVVYSGRVPSDAPVIAYRGIGSADEVWGPFYRGEKAWQSTGEYTTPIEGKTQVAASPDELVDPVHKYMYVVEMDVSGLKAKTIRKPVGGTAQADMGIGLGIDEPIPFDRIISIRPVVKGQLGDPLDLEALGLTPRKVGQATPTPAPTEPAKPTFGDVLAKAHAAVVEAQKLQSGADVPIRQAWLMAKKLKLIDPKMTVEEFIKQGREWNKTAEYGKDYYLDKSATGGREGVVSYGTGEIGDEKLAYVRAPKVAPPAEPPTPTPPPAEGVPEGETTGARKAITEPERAERGLDPVEMQLYETPDIKYKIGKAAVENGSVNPQILAASVAENPRVLTSDEIGALTYDRMDLKKRVTNAYALADAALKSGDEKAYNDARNSIVHYHNLQDLNDQALRRSSREASAALQAYKMIVKDDFSFSELSMQTRVRLGKSELTPEETDAVSKLHIQLNNAVDALHQQEAYTKALEAKLAEANAAKTTEAVAEQTRQQRRSGKRLDIAAEKKYIADQWAEIAKRAEDRKRGGSGTLSVKFLPWDPTGGVLEEATVKELANLYTRQAKVWLTERSLNAAELVDRLHEETVKHFPMMTKRQVSDIFSGYGKTTVPTDEEPQATLSKIKRERQLLSALEDVEKGQRPLKSGPQRREPTLKERSLMREVQENMRKRGIQTERTPEQQMATAMDAAKTHVRHMIEDLNSAIAKKTRLKRLPGKRLVPDEALTRMRAERDALQSMHDTMFEGEISQEKVDRVMNALADRIKAKQEALRTGDVDTKKAGPTISTPEIERQRTEIKDLNKQIADLRKSKNFEQTRKDYLIELAKREQEARQQIASKKFPEKAVRPDPYATDPEVALARRRLRVAQNQVRDIQEEAKRSGWEKVRRGGAEVLNVPRSIMETMNIHGTLRQALPLITYDTAFGTHTGGIKSVGYAFRAMFDPKFAEQVDALAQHNENEGKYELMKLHFAQKGLTDREEAFMSNIAEKIPVAGRFVRASARSYNVGLNVLRSTVADSAIAMLEAEGKTVQSHPEVYRNVGSFINKMTGWGDLGSASAFAQELNNVFYSPRLSLSRLQLMRDAATGFTGPKYDAFTRKMAIQSLAANITFQVMMMAAAKAAGFNVGTDPGSADFGKLIVGNTRVDISGGFGSFIRPVIRMATLTKRYYKGEAKAGAFRQTAEDVGYRAVKSKFSPPFSGVVEMAATKDPAGHPVSTIPQAQKQLRQTEAQLSRGDFGKPIETFLGSTPGERLSPIFVRELLSAIHEGPMGTGLAALAFFGAGETSYEPKAKKERSSRATSIRY